MKNLIFVIILVSSVGLQSCDKNKAAKEYSDNFYTALEAENYSLITFMFGDRTRADGSSMRIIKSMVLRNGTYGKTLERKLVKITETNSDGNKFYTLKYKVKFKYKTLLEELVLEKSGDNFFIEEYSYSEI